MLLFNNRRKLESLFLKWCNENGVAKTPLSVVSFLQINGLINEDKALEFIKNAETDVKSNV